MIIEYTLPKFDDSDNMYFEEEEASGLDDEVTLPLYDDNDELYGVSVRYKE